MAKPNDREDRAIQNARSGFQPPAKPEKVTLTEAKSLGFSSTKGITKQGGMYYFDKSLAPDREGFTPVGVAKPGEVQMTPYYGDVTGTYMLSQEQYNKALTMGGDVSKNILKIMAENEKAAKDKKYQELLVSIKKENPGWTEENIARDAAGQAYGYDSPEYTKSLGITTTGGGITPGGPTVTPTGGTTLSGNVYNYGDLGSAFLNTALNVGPTIGAVTPATTAAATTTGLTPLRQSIFDVLQDRFSKYGLESLVPKIKELITTGATEDTISIQLQATPEYQRRFRANQDRIKKGLSVLTPSEYLNVEDAYRQVLRAYGLNQFDTDDYVSQFIANDVSAAELSGRVVAAVQRVRNADPAISKTLKDYYGIGETDMVAYVLDPNQQLPKIERQIAAAEIGTAARRQGIDPTAAVAEQLAAQGITAAEAQKGYATIADILPTAEKLSEIYKGVEDEYKLAEAEQEVFNTLASAQRKRQRLISRETAAFSGASGLGKTSLTQDTGGQF